MSRFLFSTLLMLGPTLCHAGILYEDPIGANHSSAISSTLNFFGQVPGYRTADSFQLASGGTVGIVEWWGTVKSGGSSFEITFYSDSAGLPGASLSSLAVAPTVSGNLGTPTDPISLYSATLSTPFDAAPGVLYWISVYDAAADGSWLWRAADVSISGARQHRNNPFDPWQPIFDVAFRLEDNTEAPEPVTLSLTGSALLGLVWLLRDSRRG
jgi:hypothetical protein